MRKAHLRRHLRVIIDVAATCVVAMLPARGFSQVPVRVVVAAKSSVVRVQPSVEAKAIVGTEGGTEFTVTGSSAGWVKVALKTGGEGWLPSAEVGLKVNRSGRPCVELGLREAIELGAVDGEFLGTGASSGDAITFKGKGTLKLSICPKLERGSMLENGNGGAQNMVFAGVRAVRTGTRLRVATELKFEPEIESEYTLEAYCLDFDKDNPSESDRLRLTGVASQDVVRIMALKGSNIAATQLAIWAITDDISSADAVSKFGASALDMAAARSLMTRAGLSPGKYKLFAS